MHKAGKDKAAFFIGSPFQCLCALEAIKVFQIKSFDIYIYDDISGAEMLKKLLIEKGLEFKPIVKKRFLFLYQ